ncbi:hypothetical protein HPT29_014210 [Microvirga terrae]|uniref:Carrier domain-containing protein n=1 Tax=Microvirga terrae TaxID=2740529 RepID=A0ABY5RNU7_9HYPH|nr:hypothetical protein [Microvirga terrae]UVF17694.1 hypothetical protein HPT29_014210 [Microvirga terrae]
MGERIVALCQSLNGQGEAPIILDMSLTHSLAFDSMKLVEFFTGVEALYPGVALEDWFIENCTDGRDTLRSAVSYLARFLAPQAAKG